MLYIYGGYLLTGGKLDDGSPWQGVNVLLADVKTPDSLPMSGFPAKGKRDLHPTLQTLPIGCPVEASFDHRGKLTSIRLVESAATSDNTPTPKPMYANKEVRK